ncbi:molybdenum cofactor biosynthesis protein [Calidithermus timidus]|jgi:molybdopterin converting factor subunit 1|uniref:molybdenum cofactor biosynthesis protein n=1 Tax=Calidithermus timidus TaxID=307124 RepID=UPI00036B0989|nr:molybdenum cofactor biosynthesis protein MoaE [Calidithermus timidus]
MRVEVHFFALFREQAGTRKTTLELSEGATVRDAQRVLESRFPGLSLAQGLAAVNQELRPPEHPLANGDELAFLPPVSGGSAANVQGTRDSWGLSEAPLELQRWVDWASAPPYGAVVSFLGTTRSPNKGREVAYLEYEAYAGMAERVMQRIIAEMRERWVLGRVALWHRTGRVDPAEASILIVVSSPHRLEGFEACRYAIERVKQILPVWKKEFSPDGSHWVEGFAPEGLKL